MRSIDGQLLKNMLISASNNLYNHYPEIDALNVFPVPDGDTGMNMNLTLSSGAKEIQNRNDDDVYIIANTFSRGLLMGARGNSGVITSQIFRGFSASLKDKQVIKVNDLVEAFSSGSKVAYKAVMRPVEGTILTVIREASEALENADYSSFSIEKAMKFLINEARASLVRTPELLPVLKEVGVVDSGGAGLVKILEGMDSALNGKFIEKKVAATIDKTEIEVGGGYEMSFDLILGNISEKKSFVENRFLTTLSTHGKNILLSKNENIVKINLLTDNPGSVFTYAQNFGEFDNVKIVNKKVGNSENNSDENQKPVFEKETAIVAVSSGKGIDEYFKNLGVDKLVSGGQTMNPSTEDIISSVKSTHAKTVYLLPNNSNIVMASLQAQDVLTDEIDVKVVTTKTIPQGIVAASSFNPDASIEENFEVMNNSFASLKSGSITHAIKDTVIDGVKVYKDYALGIVDKQIRVCEKNKIKTLYNLLETMIDEESYLVTLFIGEDVSNKEEEEIRNKIVELYPDVEFDIVRGDQPVYSFLIGVE